MCIFSIYTMIDGIFVGRGVGPIALASVNLSMPFINIIFAVSIMISIGASTLISFYFGKGNENESNKIFTLNTILLVILGIVVSTISTVFLDEISLFLGATEDTIHYVKDYLGIIVLFITFYMLGYSYEIIIKAEGFPVYSTFLVLSAGVTNIVLDYILVIVFDYGIKGAAIATGMSQLLSCIICFYHFFFRKSNLKFVKVKIDWKLVSRIFSIGIPEALTELSAGYVVFVFNYVIINKIGSYGLAAFGIVMYINNLVIMVMLGVNQGIQPLISYYHGKNNIAKTDMLFNWGIKTAVFFAFLFFISAQFFTEEIIRVFVPVGNDFVYKTAYNSLKIFSYGFLVCGFNIITSGYFTALKKVKRATIISLLRGYFAVTAVIIMLPELIGYKGIWLSPFVYELITLVVSFGFYYKFRQRTLGIRA